MTRVRVSLILLALAIATPAWAEQLGEVRHSGKIVQFDASREAMVLEEMKVWHGAQQPGIVHRSIRITSDTAIDLVERADEWGKAKTALPGWESHTLTPKDLRVGDFVTVTTGAQDPSRAVSLQVIRPNA